MHSAVIATITGSIIWELGVRGSITYKHQSRSKTLVGESVCCGAVTPQTSHLPNNPACGNFDILDCAPQSEGTSVWDFFLQPHPRFFFHRMYIIQIYFIQVRKHITTDPRKMISQGYYYLPLYCWIYRGCDIMHFMCET